MTFANLTRYRLYWHTHCVSTDYATSRMIQIKARFLESTDEDAENMNLGKDHIGHVVASPSFTKDDWIKMAKIAEGLDEYNARQAKSIKKMH